MLIQSDQIAFPINVPEGKAFHCLGFWKKLMLAVISGEVWLKWSLCWILHHQGALAEETPCRISWVHRLASAPPTCPWNWQKCLLTQVDILLICLISFITGALWQWSSSLFLHVLCPGLGGLAHCSFTLWSLPVWITAMHSTWGCPLVTQKLQLVQNAMTHTVLASIVCAQCSPVPKAALNSSCCWCRGASS